jgi:hypothetical protein
MNVVVNLPVISNNQLSAVNVSVPALSASVEIAQKSYSLNL